jgi:nitrate reductase cytochrome c-type subunit
VQFVFMDCQTTCPLLASLYVNVEKKLPPDADALLVSISVTPDRDTPEKLQSWRKKFGASARWIALRSSLEDLPIILAAFGQKAPIGAAHSLQVFFVENSGGQPVYAARTTELPRASTVANALLGKAQMAGRAEAEEEAEAVTAVTGPLSGEQLYYGGQPLPARVGKDAISAKAARCASCHGAARTGAREGATVVSPLHSSDLTGSKARRGGPASSYNPQSFCTALRSGVDPAGILLSQVMPRYEVSDSGCQTLWDYLTAK